MALYAIYSYEIQEGDKNLLYKETGKRAIDMANEIISNLLNDGLTVIGKKKNEDQPLKNIHFVGRDGGDFYFLHFRAAPLNFVKSVSQNSK